MIKLFARVLTVFCLALFASFLLAGKTEAFDCKHIIQLVKPANAQSPPAALALHMTNQGNSTTAKVTWDIYRCVPTNPCGYVTGTITNIGAFNTVNWTGSDNPDAGGYY